MNTKKESILIIGFNTRPLAYSLNKANYEVYVVDFFGDLDLEPHVKDSFIITKELAASYESIKSKYQEFLVHYTFKILEKYPRIQNLIIASGLDDYFEERNKINNEIKKRDYKMKNLNNDLDVLQKSRNIKVIYLLLREMGYKVPLSYDFSELNVIQPTLSYPFILKKKKSSGGISVYKVDTREHLSFLIKKLEIYGHNSSDWLIQEYIKGIPVSCTTISNGKESKVISINRQIIGLKFLNPPKPFMYCGNIVPDNISKNTNKLISEISIKLANKLGLKGINGFDFVLRDNYPFLMEINPRIPGSIRASEESMNINLLDLHVKSFHQNMWNRIVKTIDNCVFNIYVTKLIFFAPKEIPVDKLKRINKLEFVRDKTNPIRSIIKGEPVCSILFSANSFSSSFFGGLKIAHRIKEIVS